uniref:T cell receptor associated transmembrane adaptor 1 n=1 Tax=Mus musculus TaxID=10090 RepID=A0A0R4J237_MOUSE
MSGSSGCPFFLWGLLAFLGLALVISLIFNISHYVEKQRRELMNIMLKMLQFMAI